MGQAPASFEAEDCEEGYWSCTAWNDWIAACRAADPTCRDEAREPDRLADHDFHPPHCRRPESCPLYARAMAATEPA